MMIKSILVFVSLAIFSFASGAIAEEGHDHSEDKKWHCEKKVDGKVKDLKKVKTRKECKKKGGKWKKGHKHKDEKGHSEGDGHNHG